MWMAWHRLGVRWRRFRARPGRRTLAVFVFHGVSEEPLALPDPRVRTLARLRTQLEAIARRFKVMPLREGLAALRDVRFTGPAAAIAFDGGLQSVHDLALPLLARLGLPATCFVPTAAIASARPLWFGRFHRALAETREITLAWRGMRVGFARPEMRSDASLRLQRELEDLSGPTLEAEVDAISRRLGVDPDRTAPPGSPWRPLDAGSIGRMRASGDFDFGAQGRAHAILSRLPLAAQREEIESSLAALGAATGAPAQFFAYPRGEAGDWDENSLDFLRQAGAPFAFTTVRGQCRRRTHPLELPRFVVPADVEVDRLFL